MKSFILTLLAAGLLSSCVVVRFPAEIKVHVDLPENISEEQVDRLIDEITPTLQNGKLKARIELSTQNTEEKGKEKTRK